MCMCCCSNHMFHVMEVKKIKSLMDSSSPVGWSLPARQVVSAEMSAILLSKLQQHMELLASIQTDGETRMFFINHIL